MPTRMGVSSSSRSRLKARFSCAPFPMLSAAAADSGLPRLFTVNR